MPAQDAVEEANDLDRDSFFRRHVEDALAKLDLPAKFTASFFSASSIPIATLHACLQLVEATSADDYRQSPQGWSRDEKLQEMKDPLMKFIVLSRSGKDSSGDVDENSNNLGAHSTGIDGFISFMITNEDELDVIYCYEIHLAPQWQGRRLGHALMNVLQDIGKSVGISHCMLTVFVSNSRARAFYKSLGFEWYDEEPITPPKRLRNRRTVARAPSYVILARDVR